LRVLSVGVLISQETSRASLKQFQPERSVMQYLPLNLWNDEDGQDIAEYAVMLAVILVLVVGTIRLVGSNANNAFSSVASSIQ
jgi:Flp pilus assembly pilin Flp